MHFFLQCMNLMEAYRISISIQVFTSTKTSSEICENIGMCYKDGNSSIFDEIESGSYR